MSACTSLQGVLGERAPHTLQVPWYRYEVDFLLSSGGNQDDVVQMTVLVLQPGLKLHCVNHFRLDVLQLDQGNITDSVALKWPG